MTKPFSEALHLAISRFAETCYPGAMAGSLPAAMSLEAFRAWRADPSSWLPTIRGIARAHALPHDMVEPFPNGTNLVVALDRHLVLKLFPPSLRHQFLSERATLTALHGRLSVPVPKIVIEGEDGPWSYLVMTRLSGRSGKEAWPLLRENEKEALLDRLGELIAEVQRVPARDLVRLEPQWSDFIPQQIAGCRARHERLGLPGKFLLGLDALLENARRLIPLYPSPVILTGEYVPENLLFICPSGEWRLCGLIDFGDVMTGFCEYDLLGPIAFMAAGRPQRTEALLRGFGYAKAAFDKTLTCRLMALLLLHRFSDLRHIAIEAWQEKADSLAELERLIWPVGSARGHR